LKNPCENPLLLQKWLLYLKESLLETLFTFLTISHLQDLKPGYGHCQLGTGDCQICRQYFKETFSRFIEATLAIVHFQKDISRVYALLQLCKSCSCLQLLFFSGYFVHMVSSGRGHQIMGGNQLWACENYLCLEVSFVKDYPCSPGDIYRKNTDSTKSQT
jgi:hypothetical protein